jgi:hypothetical protein
MLLVCYEFHCHKPLKLFRYKTRNTAYIRDLSHSSMKFGNHNFQHCSFFNLIEHTDSAQNTNIQQR